MSKGFLQLILALTVITASQASTSSILTSLLTVQTAASANNPCADIRNGQYVCLDCSTLAFCVQEGGVWMTMQIACPTAYSTYCNEESKSCVFQKECHLPPKGVRFECQNPGKFPDPYNCKVYHECSNLNKDTRIMCPSGTIYSTATQNCQQQSTTDADVCGKAEYRCDYPGMMGAWPSDNNIYYVCNVKRIDGEVIYYPLMYRCLTGQVFDGKKCDVSTSTTNANGNNGNNNNNGNPSGASCKENYFTTHPSNCHAYYHCENGKNVLYQCPQNMYYNAKRAACEIGKC